MSKAPKKSSSLPAKNSKSKSFFSDQFGKKKESVHAKRGGTNRADKDLHKQYKKDKKEGKLDETAEKPDNKLFPKPDKQEKKPFYKTDKPAPHLKKNMAKKWVKEEEPEPTKIARENSTAEMPLNKYIAHSGVCGRREAAELVKQGKVKVNDKVVLEPGYKVQPKDDVQLAGKKLTPVKDLVYLLLNKPKDFVTTTNDPEGRKTVMQLMANAGVPRLYPIGRLDRNTTGVLLFTNDGELAQRLSHPKFNVKKVYQATLNKAITPEHITQLTTGVILDDGEAKADSAFILEQSNEVGLEIHSGRNRIVRRMFETLGYDVEKLDRVIFAGLTKKNVPRGKWRSLTEKEIIFLKHFKQ